MFLYLGLLSENNRAIQVLEIKLIHIQLYIIDHCRRFYIALVHLYSVSI